ncbi:hypothetical protein RSAG8_08166, partial [Rhizoctonia solani AG-8 WAC10335]
MDERDAESLRHRFESTYYCHLTLFTTQLRKYTEHITSARICLDREELPS